jgi:exopolysaccharide biosynthesis predicted pyruvyltransferase EpsI
MTSPDLEQFELGRAKLLTAIGEPQDLTFIRTPGNVGDQLIHAGARQLLSPLRYREVCISEVHGLEGDVALLGGGGAWCGVYQSLPGYLPRIEERFARVIVLPSTFDTKVDRIREILSHTRATVFAREKVSYSMIRDLCAAEIAHDCAFYFDFRPYRQKGRGVLTAFRTDQESAFRAVPSGNQDISATCGSLEKWLGIISNHELVRTDRAHVTIAGAMLGKRVEYLASNYFKVPAIVDYSLRGFPVTRLPEDWLAALEASSLELTDSEYIRRLITGITTIVPTGATFILVDSDRIGTFPLNGQKRLPFLERNGVFWGPPGSDQQAISELERMRRSGAHYIVFAWLAFWWFDQYAGFRDYLRSTFPCLLENESLVVFDLRSRGT